MCGFILVLGFAPRKVSFPSPNQYKSALISCSYFHTNLPQLMNHFHLQSDMKTFRSHSSWYEKLSDMKTFRSRSCWTVQWSAASRRGRWRQLLETNSTTSRSRSLETRTRTSLRWSYCNLFYTALFQIKPQFWTPTFTPIFTATLTFRLRRVRWQEPGSEPCNTTASASVAGGGGEGVSPI